MTVCARSSVGDLSYFGSEDLAVCEVNGGDAGTLPQLCD
jgi:hypothetical protein